MKARDRVELGDATFTNGCIGGDAVVITDFRRVSTAGKVTQEFVESIHHTWAA